MINKILLSTILLLEFAISYLWLQCQALAGKFYFSGLDAQLKLEEAVRNDIGYPPYIARFFHNKINIYGTELLNKYIQFWDVRFDVVLFSLVGCFGIAYGFWHLFSNKKKTLRTWLFITVLAVIPFLEIAQILLPYWLRITIIILSYSLFSLYGIWHFLKRYKKLGVAIVIVLIILSFWYLLVLQKDISSNFCYN